MRIDCKNILAIGSHPDDIEISSFGFLLKQAKLGKNIAYKYRNKRK